MSGGFRRTPDAQGRDHGSLDPGGGGVRGLLLRQAWPARDLPQSHQDLGLDFLRCQTVKVVVVNYVIVVVDTDVVVVIVVDASSKFGRKNS